MKNLLTSKLLKTTLSLLATTVLFPAAALAHSGHMANDAVHGFLHVEHIILIAAVSLVVYVVKTLKDK